MIRAVVDFTVRAIIWILGPVAVLLFIITASPVQGDEPGDVRGCMVTYRPRTGGFGFEPFLKVADKGSPNEDGEAEVWGFRPWNLEPPDENGVTKPVNILADRFVPLGVFAEVKAGTTRKRIRCPEGLWRDGDGGQ